MESEIRKNPIEIWGGVECTIVRMKNDIHDQLEKSGHESRPDDMRLIAGLGIKTIRYPLLWEKSVRDKNFFRLHDERLQELIKSGIEPIAGLLHHGSGPFHTALDDPDFPYLLAEYAYNISKRYPWITSYTPVNEPLTTARFSGLYGIWYPHMTGDHSFLKMFLNQMKGIVLSMQAIRANNPQAALIQTEDLCKIHSTKQLKYQADFENHRRWLTYDLLTGKFDFRHPLWNYLIQSGIHEKEIEFFLENVTTPAVCGFNYYVSSERYLDQNLRDYPQCHHGGNGTHTYADVEAVRVSNAQIDLYSLLKDAWMRYQLPLALTEIHIACTREEQMRWFYEAFQTGNKLTSEGVNFRAITAWSLLGSYDWDTLLQNKNNTYECGAFDVRSGIPRPTALAKMICELNSGIPSGDRLLEIPGWWRRNIRQLYGRGGEMQIEVDGYAGKKILILGATGSLGKALVRICNTRGLIFDFVKRDQFDITSKASLEKMIDEKQPWAVINATGYSRIDDAETCPEACFLINTRVPSMLAEICGKNQIRLVTFSTDQVFNGKKRNPYIESDIPEPLNVFGASKQQAEESVLHVNPDTLIIRSSSFFNPWYENDMLGMIIQSDPNLNIPFYLPSDIIMSPTYIPHMVNASLDLLIDNEKGIWHLSSEEEITYFRFIKLAFKIAGISDRNLHAVHSSKLNYIAERPPYSVLSNSQGFSLPPLFDALVNYLSEYQLIRK